MEEEHRSYPLLMELAKRSRPPLRWLLILVAVVLMLLLVSVAFLDGDRASLATLSFWRDLMDGPALIIYILAVYPILYQRWWRSALSLRTLLSPDDKATMPVPLPKRQWEWTAIIVGSIFWPLLWQPWQRNWVPGDIWINAYDVGTQIVLFSLMGWIVYTVFIGNRYTNRLSRLRLNVDVFDTEPLMPIARSSLGFSLAFIGGISLSLIFQTQESLLRWANLVVWAAVICFAILLFFVSMWSIHTVLAGLKKHELALVRQHLKTVSRRLNLSDVDGLGGKDEFSSTITALLIYEKRVKEAPEWPYNAGIIRELMASTLVPIVVFLVKVISRLGIGT